MNYQPATSERFTFNYPSQLDKIAQNYYRLSSLKRLTSSEEEELGQILRQAEQDSALSFLIAEIDNILDSHFQLDESTVNANPSCSERLKALMAEWSLENNDEQDPFSENEIDDSLTTVDSDVSCSR